MGKKTASIKIPPSEVREYFYYPKYTIMNKTTRLYLIEVINWSKNAKFYDKTIF